MAITCNDGAFRDASTSASYQPRPLYFTAAYEHHTKVNRSSDIYGIYGAYPSLPRSL